MVKILLILTTLLPAALEMERAVLGAMLVERNAVPQGLSILSKEHFSNTRHSYVFEAISYLASNEQPVDILTVKERLQAQKRLGSDGMALLIELTNVVVSAANIESHARAIQEKYLERKMIELGEGYSRKVQSGEYDPIALSQSLVKDATQLQNIFIQKKFRPNHIVVAEAIKELEKVRNSEDKLLGNPTGLREYDRVTAGRKKGNLSIVAARPGMGKTSFALQEAHFKAQLGMPVAFFSMEMPHKQLLVRLASISSGVSREYFIKKKCSESDALKFIKEAGEISDNLLIDDTAALTITQLKSRAMLMKQEYGIEEVYVDYLQLMSGVGRIRENVIGEISRGLKSLAKDLDVPVIALSQLSRAVEDNTHCKPKLSNLRESGAIEQDADDVTFLYRPEYYKYNETEYQGNIISSRGICELIIEKNRDGACTTVVVEFKDYCTSFSDYENSPF